MALTKPQRARLDKLATYLEKLPKSYQHFAMSRWIADVDSGESVIRYARNNGGVKNCGTAACAAGHGPAAGVLVPPRFIRGNFGAFSVYWDGYCSLFVPDVGADDEGVYSKEYIWCFYGLWAECDDHHYGAAARIRYLLDHGTTPEGFSYPGREWLKVYRPYRIDVKALEAA